MKGVILADWMTVRGNSSLSPTITQGEACWMDAGDHEDAVFYLEVKEVTGTLTFSYETATVPEANTFITLVAFTLVTGTRTDLVLASYASPPILRYLRWKLQGSSNPFDATFRVHVALS